MKQATAVAIWIILFSNAKIACAQDDNLPTDKSDSILFSYLPSNILNLEFGGNSTLISYNYEHIFKNHFGYRIGIGLSPKIGFSKPRSENGGKAAGVIVIMAEYHYRISKTLYIKGGSGILSLTSFDNREVWQYAPDPIKDTQPFLLTNAIGLEYIHLGGGFTASYVLSFSLTFPRSLFFLLQGLQAGATF